MHYLKPEYVENIINAVGYAEQIDAPLTAHFTVTWFAKPGENIRGYQIKLFERYKKWARYHGFKAAYVWSLENGSSLGLHTHILLHVPKAYRHELRRRMFKRWVIKACGRWKDKMVRGRRIPRHLEPVPNERRMTTLADLERRTLYLVKDVKPDSDLAATLPFERLRKRGDRYGHVDGKRCGTSRNIGAHARALAA